MSQIEINAAVGTGKIECKQFTVNNDISVVCYFRDSGNDSATAKYFNLNHPAYRCGIKLNNIAEITHINGKELSSPIPLGTTNWNSWTVGIQWNRITVRAIADSTTFTVVGY